MLIRVSDGIGCGGAGTENFGTVAIDYDDGDDVQDVVPFVDEAVRSRRLDWCCCVDVMRVTPAEISAKCSKVSGVGVVTSCILIRAAIIVVVIRCRCVR